MASKKPKKTKEIQPVEPSPKIARVAIKPAITAQETQQKLSPNSESIEPPVPVEAPATDELPVPVETPATDELSFPIESPVPVATSNFR